MNFCDTLLPYSLINYTYLCTSLCGVLKRLFSTFSLVSHMRSLEILFINRVISWLIIYDLLSINECLFMPRNFMQKHLLVLMERAFFATIPVFIVNHGESTIDAKFMLVCWTSLVNRHTRFTCVITRDALNYLDHRALISSIRIFLYAYFQPSYICRWSSFHTGFLNDVLQWVVDLKNYNE